MPDETNILIEPRDPRDRHDASDVLNEVYQVLHKYGYVMIDTPPHGMVLARLIENNKAVGEAIVGRLAPEGIEYKMCGPYRPQIRFDEQKPTRYVDTAHFQHEVEELARTRGMRREDAEAELRRMYPA